MPPSISNRQHFHRLDRFGISRKLYTVNWKGCEAVESRDKKMSGAFVFTGTRIPVATLFESLKAGATVDEFLEWYSGLERNQIEAVLSFVAGSEPQEAA